MSNLPTVSSKQPIRCFKDLKSYSGDQCLSMAKEYLGKSSVHFFISCICLAEAHEKIKKTDFKLINWYKEENLSKERVNEMIRVAKNFKDFKSAKFRTFNNSSLILLGGMGRVGRAIVRKQEIFKVEDLKKIKKATASNSYKNSNDEEIIEATYKTIKTDKPSKKLKKNIDPKKQVHQAADILMNVKCKLKKLDKKKTTPLSKEKEAILDKKIFEIHSATKSIVEFYNLNGHRGDK